ncbi:MAG: bifunctional methylenetetrahydrofolate dehydrogenase/methenyltetrahydrofolate cyclohydrolase [Alphaproteobacteria bacterium]|nr:bifunctional methylenetetrahydrofolate dehydrogenase/methenyltetrahydrofolate cyclohydrolase [Alphaproteobacteria bacterium]
MAKIINGKKIATEFCDSVRDRVSELKMRGISPRIALINASNDPASEIYVSKKEALAASVGIESDIYKFTKGTKEADIIELIEKLNNDEKVHAILLQSPLMEGLRFRELINHISPNKDVDGLTSVNQGRLFSGEPGLVPCTPLGVLHLIHSVHEKIAGLHAVVIGRSSIVGRPMTLLLLNANCTVTALHSYSRNLEEVCKTADILVSATGHPKIVGKNFIKPGATVIDVGITRVIEADGTRKIIGDVDFDEVSEIAGAITPVPNGVGPMTVAYLMYNTLKLACCY